MRCLCAVASLGSVASYTCHLCAVATLRSVASYTCHLCAVATLGKATGRRVSGNGVASYPAIYALLRRWERLRVGASAGMASPPTSTFTQHPSPNTQHPTPITQHPSPNTQHPSPNTQHPTPITQHPSPITQHPTPNTQQKKWALPVVDGSAFHYACYEKK